MKIIFIKLVNNVSETDEIDILLTDQYSGINAKEFKKFQNNKQFPIVFTAGNSPFSNGFNERLNQRLVKKIRCKINEEGNKRAWTIIARECVS